MRNKNLKWSKIASKRGVEVTCESKGREKEAPFKSSRVKVTVLTCSVLWCIRPVWVVPSGASAAHRDVCAGGKGTVPAHSTNGNDLSPHRWEEAYWTSHLCPLIVIKNLKFSPPASDPSSLGQAPACIITIIIMEGFFLFLTVSLHADNKHAACLLSGINFVSLDSYTRHYRPWGRRSLCIVYVDFRWLKQKPDSMLILMIWGLTGCVHL